MSQYHPITLSVEEKTLLQDKYRVTELSLNRGLEIISKDGPVDFKKADHWYGLTSKLVSAGLKQYDNIQNQKAKDQASKS